MSCSSIRGGGGKRYRSTERRRCSRLPKQIVHHNISLSNNTQANKPLFRMLAYKHSASYLSHVFHITSGNDDGTFDVAKTRKDGRIAGIVFPTRQLVGPKDYTLDLTLKMTRRRKYITLVARLYIYVSEFSFWWRRLDDFAVKLRQRWTIERAAGFDCCIYLMQLWMMFALL